jgi:hypothetical protein
MSEDSSSTERSVKPEGVKSVSDATGSLLSTEKDTYESTLDTEVGSTSGFPSKDTTTHRTLAASARAAYERLYLKWLQKFLRRDIGSEAERRNEEVETLLRKWNSERALTAKIMLLGLLI